MFVIYSAFQSLVRKVCKVWIWVTHDLWLGNQAQCLIICSRLLTRMTTFHFFYCIIVLLLYFIVLLDVEWILHVNCKYEKSISISKAESQPQNSLLCVWLNRKGVVLYDLQEHERIITAGVYCQQRDRVNVFWFGK